MSSGPLVLGDMGHSLFRLGRARATGRAASAGGRFDVKEVLYLGFEGRPPAEDFDAFMENVEMQVDVYRMSHRKPLMYTTGFGSMVLLALRARGKVKDLPSVIQGAIPWESVRSRAPGAQEEGEEERQRYANPSFREAFVVDHLHSPLDALERDSFFSGFTTCTAFPQIYGWMNAGWLASLEGQLASRPPAIDDIRVWLCGEDSVVCEDEHDAAIRALGASWPTERAAGWGHFPYLDAPGPWIGALQSAWS